MGSIIREIRQHAFFEGFPEALFKELRTCADQVPYGVDEFIYRQGDPAEAFLILQGRIALELYGGHHGAMIVQTVGEGEILGWSWLFLPIAVTSMRGRSPPWRPFPCRPTVCASRPSTTTTWATNCTSGFHGPW